MELSPRLVFLCLDLRMCLEWVQENAKYFGADPGSVTVYGQGAGATSIAWHLAADFMDSRERGVLPRLLHTAILQSPAGFGVRANGREEAEEQGQVFAARNGCHSLACLRGLPWQQLASATPSSRGSLLLPVSDAWTPWLDGTSFRGQPMETLVQPTDVTGSPMRIVLGHGVAEGHSLVSAAFPRREPSLEQAREIMKSALSSEEAKWFNGSDCLLGLADGAAVAQHYERHCEAMRDFYRGIGKESHLERIPYILAKYRGQEEQLWNMLSSQYSSSSQVKEAAKSSPPATMDGTDLLSRVLQDMYFSCPLRRLARSLQRKGHHVHFYLIEPSVGAAAHGAELPPLFEGSSKRGLSRYWSRVSSGEDLGQGDNMHAWPLFDGQGEAISFWGLGGGGVSASVKALEGTGDCHLWDQIFPDGVPSRAQHGVPGEGFYSRIANTHGLLMNWMAIASTTILLAAGIATLLFKAAAATAAAPRAGK